MDEMHRDKRWVRRRYGHAPIGTQPVRFLIDNRGVRWNVFGALSMRGFIALHITTDHGTYATYDDFVGQHLYPALRPFPHEHSILLADNAKIHDSPGASALYRHKGAIVLRLAPYEPDYQPIEHAWDYVDRKLRQDVALSNQNLPAAIARACRNVTPQIAASFFKRSGYY